MAWTRWARIVGEAIKLAANVEVNKTQRPAGPKTAKEDLADERRLGLARIS